MAFIRKNGVTSGFEWLRKLPGGIANKRIRDTLYPPLPEDRSMRCDRRESCIFVQRLSTFIDRYNRKTQAQRDVVFQRALLHILPYI